MDILSVVTRVPILVFGVERHDDDFADRINYKYTVAVLVIFAIIVTNRQFGTKQIHCWIPAYFTRNYEEYINDICWVSNTYYISLDQKLPEAEQIRKSFELKYYQWVPFILLSQAFFFYIPHIAWRALSRRSGIDVRDIVEAASNYKSVDKYENRQKYMSYMLTAVDQYVDDPRRRKETRRSLLLKRLLSAVCCISGKFLGNYLMVLYLFIKLAFIANCISQLFVLNLLLGHEFHKFGFELLDKIINGKGWDTGSRIFPKISMCDFRIREVGNPKVSHRYTVQCVLPINLFNQQIFTFIWFWYGIVLIVNIYSLCVWTYRFLPSKRLRYVTRRIEIMRQALFWKNKNPLNFEPSTDLEMHEFEKDLIQHFVHDYLESDGLFILRVLSSNTSDFVCTELIQELWKYYRKQRKFNRSSDDEDDLNDDESIDYKRNNEDFEEFNNQKVNRDRNRNKNHENMAHTIKPRNLSNRREKSNSHHRPAVPHRPSFNHEMENDDDLDNDEDDDENLDDENEEESTYQDVTKTSISYPRRNTATGINNSATNARLARMSPVYTRNLDNSSKKKMKSKPLSAIGEQIVSMYNKTKKQPESPGSPDQGAQRPRLSRTLSHDPKTLNSVNTYLVTKPMPQKQSKLKRPNNLGNKKLDTVVTTPPAPPPQPPPSNNSSSSLPQFDSSKADENDKEIQDSNSNTSNNSNGDRLNKDQAKLKSKYLETET